MIIDQDETLHEIMGTFIRNRYSSSPGYSPSFGSTSTSPSKNNNEEDLIITGIKMRNCNTLEGWQREIVKNLTPIRDGNGIDQYIVARPGGGKTLPIICYWADQMLKLNTTQQILNVRSNSNYDVISKALKNLFNKDQTDTKKILMMVPVISLALQTAAEFRRDLASVMMQYYNSNPSDVLRYITQFDKILDELYSRKGKVQKELDKTPKDDYKRMRLITEALKSINQALVEQVVRYIVNIVNNRVYIKTGQSDTRTPIDEACVFVGIYESSPSLISSIKNLSLIVVDEAHLAQPGGIDIEDQSRSYQIAGAIYNVLNKVKHQSDCRLVFLTGTINPSSAAALTNYLNKYFNRNFPKDNSVNIAPKSAANRSFLSVVRNESIRTTEGIINSIIRAVHQNDWGQLYVLFSTKTISDIVNTCVDKIGIRNIENSSHQGYQPTNVFSSLGQEREKTGSIKLNDLDLLSIPKDMQLEVSNITNPLLRQSVLRGIGFIHRKIPGDLFSDQKELRMDDRDKLIVAKLFKDRKINVLLATDAVGIGVNIDVKELYIPSLERYNDTIKNHALLSLRDLAQILNRAGRGATPVASIQTPQENIEIVTNALMAGPDDFPEVSVHKKRKHEIRDNFERSQEKSKEYLYNLIQKVRHPIESNNRKSFR